MTARNARKRTEMHAQAPRLGFPCRIAGATVVGRAAALHRGRSAASLRPLAGESRSEAEHYTDIPGFCHSVGREEVGENGCILTPGHYMGAPEEGDDDEAFEEKMGRLTVQLAEQMEKGVELDGVIREKLGELGYEV